MKTQNAQLARSQDVEKRGGGLFWKSETTVSDLDPNFHCFRIRFKEFIRNWDGFFGRNRKLKRFFRPNHGNSFTTSSPNPRLFSFFEQKSASKALKTCDFAYFSGQWGGLEPPRPWLRYWCPVCSIHAFMAVASCWMPHYTALIELKLPLSNRRFIVELHTVLLVRHGFNTKPKFDDVNLPFR